ncbi:MAG: hypothetical protein DMF89_03580 [Acidobacteria bacterium]|nr:MAG: hypothetical protein DMF89_03580 [Acidobacteriota bacterium]
MLEIRQILCPIDFSEVSRHALDHARVFAGWYRARVTALHVRNPAFLQNPPLLFAEAPPGGGTAETDREYLEGQLRDWVGSLKTAGIETDVLVDEHYNPSARIVDHAKTLPADLIVMGTHGRGGFERLILGSVAEKVLRKASCPVLTVPAPTVTSSKLPLKRMLCPVDFSEPSIAALELAFSIAEESDGRLTILHVFDWPTDDEVGGQWALDLPEVRRQVEERARQRVEALVPRQVRDWCSPVPTLRYGKAYREILALADAEHTDLIVMGVHGRNAVDMMLFGSTTNHVVRSASCPVLTLRR